MTHASVLYKACKEVRAHPGSIHHFRCKEEYYYYVFFLTGRGGPEQSRFSRFLLLFFALNWKLEMIL
jgi:hypothetical protein